MEVIADFPNLEEDNYKERLVLEYWNVKERYKKLHKFLVRYDAGNFTGTLGTPHDILLRQAHIMERYIYILELRAEIENIDLNDI